MTKRIVPVLLLAAVIAYACGPRSPSSEPARKHVVAGHALASSLEVHVADGVTFAFRVTNGDLKRTELTFPSGLTHDIVVLDAIGREVWRWSEGRMFTQAMQNRVLEANETMTYEANWKGTLPQGKYVAIASLSDQDRPLEQRVEFSIP